MEDGRCIQGHNRPFTNSISKTQTPAISTLFLTPKTSIKPYIFSLLHTHTVYSHTNSQINGGNRNPKTLNSNRKSEKIVKFDKDITRINSEALFLITGATELFLHFLAEESAKIASEKKRRNVKLDHLRIAVKRHQPTRDFLLDSLPMPSQPSDHPPADRTVKEKAQLPRNTRRIDSFFSKPLVNDDAGNEAHAAGDDEDES